MQPGLQSRMSRVTGETADDHFIHSTNQAVAIPQILPPEFGCYCSASETWDNPSRSSSDTFNHEEACPLSCQNRKRYVIFGSLKLFGCLFRYRIGIQYSRWAARDFQTQPHLTIHAIRQNGTSPAFKIVYKTMCVAQRNRLTVLELQNTLQNCLRTLRGLFSKGKAWPTDVEEDGGNLLHVRNITSPSHTHTNAYGAQYAFRSGFGPVLNEKTSVMFLQYWKALISMGVPLNNVSSSFLGYVPYFSVLQVTRDTVKNPADDLEQQTTICFHYGVSVQLNGKSDR